MPRTVIISGAGRGIGRALAEALLQDGFNVVGTASRTPDELAELQSSRHGDALLTVQADVGSDEDCERVVAMARERFGDVDALINNAGRGMIELSPDFNVTPTRFWETSSDTWRELVRVNLLGVFAMARAAVPALIESGGSLLNVSTSPVTMLRRGYTPYGATKAAVESLSAAWAEELAPLGVRVNVILPGGATDTAFLGPRDSGADRRGADGQCLPPTILNEPVRFLLSEAANELTGRRIVGKGFDASQAARAPRIADVGIAVSD